MSRGVQREMIETMAEALVPFLAEVGERLPVERWSRVIASDRELCLLGLLYAELPALAEEAAEEAARHLYGEGADSALRFLAGQVHAEANRELATTAEQIRERLAILVGES